MTIGANFRNDYNGTGATDTYSYGFKITSKEHLLVTQAVISTGVETTLTVDVDYTVTGVGKQAGGTIVLTAGNLAATDRITIRDAPATIQSTDIKNQGEFFPETHEEAFDYGIRVSKKQQDSIDRSLKSPETIPTSVFDPTLPAPVAGYAWRINNAGDGVELFQLGDGSAITLPAGLAFMVQTAVNTFTARTFQTTGDISITNPDGQAGDPVVDSTTIDNKVSTNTTNITTNTNNITTLNAVAAPFTATEQDTPDDTVKLTGGNVFDPSGTGPTVVVAAGAADAITFPVVSANSRIDVLSVDFAGTVTRTAGSEAPSPTPPAYPANEYPICEVTIDETVTVVVNDADIKDIRSSLTPLNPTGDLGSPLLFGQVSSAGSILLNEDGGSGASYTVSGPSSGNYDITLTGISGSYSNVAVLAILNDQSTGNRTGFLKGVTAKNSNTGVPTNTGFRIYMEDLYHSSCGGCPYMDRQSNSAAWSFMVWGVN